MVLKTYVEAVVITKVGSVVFFEMQHCSCLFGNQGSENGEKQIYAVYKFIQYMSVIADKV